MITEASEDEFDPVEVVLLRCIWTEFCLLLTLVLTETGSSLFSL